MAKDKLTEYDATAANNTVVGDVNLAENSALPSDMNNAVREVMSHQKEAFGSGTPLYVDQTNNRVGIGNSAPSTALEVDADGATVLTVDRATSDGTVIDIQKDGTSAGIIAARVSNLRIGTDDIGLEFHKTNNTILPANMTAATLPDNTTDLGQSNVRFKDLYLGGGAYIGGTGSANLLDDYEEGNWTPVVAFGGGTSGITYGTQYGRYVKIGEQVMLQCTISMTSKGSSSGAARIQGMPFNQGGTGFHCTGMQMFNFTGGTEYVVAQTAGGTNEVAVIRLGADQSLDNSDFANNTGIRFSIVYRI